MSLIDGLLQELEEEAMTTRRVLERVPDNQRQSARSDWPLAQTASKGASRTQER